MIYTTDGVKDIPYGIRLDKKQPGVIVNKHVPEAVTSVFYVSGVFDGAVLTLCYKNETGDEVVLQDGTLVGGEYPVGHGYMPMSLYIRVAGAGASTAINVQVFGIK